MEIQHKNKIRGWEAEKTKETISSAPSSPSHEFSFTISLISQPLAIDLTPADDIFFHGHLLPLHQHKPHNIHSCICPKCDTKPKRHSFNSYEYTNRRHDFDRNKMNNEEEEEEEEFHTKTRIKAKTFSLFGRSRRAKQGESRCEDQDEKRKKKLRFDHVSHFVKKYIAMFSKTEFRKQGYPMKTNQANLSNDSTMEELQAAIQSAIAHCKNSAL